MITRRILFLDIDGVLNRTGYRPAQSTGLRSWIEPALAARLTALLRATGAVIVLASDWRRGRDLAHLAAELHAAGVEGTLVGATPELTTARWREIAAWMAANDVTPAQIAIIDDGYDMGELDARFVRISPLTGLDDDAARAVAALFGS